MNLSEKITQTELEVIAAMALYPDYTMKAIEKIGIVRDDFADPQLGECFSRLLKSENKNLALVAEAYEVAGGGSKAPLGG